MADALAAKAHHAHRSILQQEESVRYQEYLQKSPLDLPSKVRAGSDRAEGRRGQDFVLLDGRQSPMIRQSALPLVIVCGSAFRVSALDRKSTRLNSSHRCISYAVFC